MSEPLLKWQQIFTILDAIMDIITMRLIYLPWLLVQIFKNRFHYVAIIALTKGFNSWHEFQSLGRGLHGNQYNTFRLSLPNVEIKKIFLKEKIQFIFIAKFV